MITARLCAIASEIIVITSTILSIRHTGTLFGERNGESLLQKVVLKHGIGYFVSLTLLNVLEIILYYSDPVWVGPLVSFTLPISSILVSRFLLDLGASVKREDQHGIDGSELHTFSQATEVDTVQSMKFIVPSDSMLDAYDTGCIRPSSEADVLTSPQVRNIDTLVATEA